MIREFLGPLRRRLLLVFAIVLVVPTLFGILAAIDHYQSQVEQARRSTERFATLASSNETNLIWQSQRIADDLARDPSVLGVLSGGGDSAACEAALKKAIDPYPAYGVASLLATNGDPLCRSSGNRTRTNAASEEWFVQAVAAGEPALSGYKFGELLKEPILAYGSPVKGSDGRTLGVIGLGIRLRWLAASGQEPGLPPEASVELLDKHGKPLITSEPSGQEGSGLPDPQLLQGMLSEQTRSFDAVGQDGVARHYAIHRIADGALFVLLGQPSHILLGPLQRDLATQISVLSLLVLGGLAAAVVGSRLLVTRWIVLLTEEARAIAAGEAPPNTPSFAGAPTEIRELNETLANMAAEIKTREAELSESLMQKQMMLREIHHRVKNNLQTVTSLLNLYARIPRGEAIKAAFADVQTRINTLALVHRHLYESQDLQEIDLASFMSGLCRLVQDGSGVPARRVRLSVDIPSATLSGDRAVPLALLTTELLTNAFKHAFPDHRTGSILIKLTKDDAGNARLVIADDGIGYHDRDESSPTSTMGKTLIGAFTRQLGGTLEITGPPGTTVTLDFTLEPKPQEPVGEPAPAVEG